MATQFDAYYTWLGIPPDEQPPNHYRLLGIKIFESNRDVIQHAADRQMAHLKNFNNSQNAAHAQRLLNELSTATVCLLNVEKKLLYDQQLKVPPTFSGAAQRAPMLSQRDVVAIAAELPIIAVADPLVTPLSVLVTDSLPAQRGRRRGSADRSGPPPWLGLAVVGVLVLIVFIVGIALMSAGGSEEEQPAGAGAAAQHDRG